MSTSVIVLVVIAAVALVVAVSAIRIVREYERVVVFRLGRLRSARGPSSASRRPSSNITKVFPTPGAAPR